MLTQALGSKAEEKNISACTFFKFYFRHCAWFIIYIVNLFPNSNTYMNVFITY